jgi:hypothetical protein
MRYQSELHVPQIGELRRRGAAKLLMFRSAGLKNCLLRKHQARSIDTVHD